LRAITQAGGLQPALSGQACMNNSMLFSSSCNEARKIDQS